MKSWYDGIVLHMATESQAKCELKGNFKKLVSVAAWMRESADNHETSFKIEAFFVSGCGVFAHPESTLPGLKASVEILL